jgi:hypothetical protein
MEFYELNRLYDSSLPCLSISLVIDNVIYIVTPIVLVIGFVISLITIIGLSNQHTSVKYKTYFLAHAIFHFVFQIVTLATLATNYYEKSLLNTYFAGDKKFYLRFKTFLNFIYNILFYNIIWVCAISLLDFSLYAIVRSHINSNYFQNYRMYLHKNQQQIVRQSHQQHLERRRQKMANLKRQYNLSARSNQNSTTNPKLSQSNNNVSIIVNDLDANKKCFSAGKFS